MWRSYECVEVTSVEKLPVWRSYLCGEVTSVEKLRV